MGGLSSVSFYGADKALGSLKGSIRGDKGGSQTVGRPTQGQGFSRNGYNPKPGERTFKGYVNRNVLQDAEVSLYTNAEGFNNVGNIGGEFKRYGTVSGRHGVDGPHVHQPMRNVKIKTDEIRGGVFNPKKGIGVDSPNRLDIKQLYQYLANGKYKS